MLISQTMFFFSFRYNFESGFSDWKQPSGHKLKFIIDSGDSTFATGPRFDHTFQESYG